MHICHEFMEMRAAFLLHWTVFEEHVHQHGLAAADVAVDVEASRRRPVAVREQPAEQSLLAHGLIAGEPLLQVLQRRGGRLLRRVGLDCARRNQGLVLGAERAGRSRQHVSLTASTRAKMQAENWRSPYALAPLPVMARCQLAQARAGNGAS